MKLRQSDITIYSYHVFLENRTAFVTVVSFSRAKAACERLGHEAEEKSYGEWVWG